MHQRLLPTLTLLLAIPLLLSTLSCSQKDDPDPVQASYKLDGNVQKCQAKATTSAGSIGARNYDFLDIDLRTLPAGEPETLTLHLYKLPGAPASTYLLHNLSVYPKGGLAPYNFAGTAFTLVVSEGSFSGTFSAVVNASSSSIPGPYTTITDGVFADVRP